MPDADERCLLRLGQRRRALRAVAANGNVVGELSSGASAAMVCSNARSLLASQATRLAWTTRPLEKMSQCRLPFSCSFDDSATQCEVSIGPEGAMQTAVPASCCAKTKAGCAASARAADFDSCGRFKMKFDV